MCLTHLQFVSKVVMETLYMYMKILTMWLHSLGFILQGQLERKENENINTVNGMQAQIDALQREKSQTTSNLTHLQSQIKEINHNLDALTKERDAAATSLQVIPVCAKYVLID